MLSFLTVFVVASAAFAQDVQVIRALPRGEDAKSVRQITFTFNQKMVPLGSMERTADQLGVRIEPAVKCQWRWLDPSNLSCELAEGDELRSATVYRLALKAGLTSLSGAKLPSDFVHQFSTPPPSATHSNFITWSSPGTPHIVVRFNQPVSRRSVEAAVVFRSGETRVPVRVEVPPYDRKTAPYIRHRGTSGFVFVEDSENSPAEQSAEDVAREQWIFIPRKSLPQDAEARLDLEPGLESALGPLRGSAKNIVNFHTFPEFRFAGIRCMGEGGKTRDFDETQAAEARCLPLEGVSLLFTSPVLKEELRGKLKVVPPLAAPGQEEQVWEGVWSYSRLGSPHAKGKLYDSALPSFLKARTLYRIRGAGLADQFGRKLKSPIDYAFETEPRKPNLVFPHTIGVLEKDENSEIPLYVTNIPEITIQFDRLSAKGPARGLKKTIRPSSVQDLSFAIPMDARSMIEQGSSVLLGTLTAPAADPGKNRFFIQVTPFQVMAKLGHYNTTVWVTDMKTGLPVKDARIELVRGTYQQIIGGLKVLDKGATDDRGLVSLKGASEVDPRHELPGYSDWDAKNDFLMVRVQRGTDLAVLPLDWRFAVEWYRINASVYPSREKKWGHVRVWGTTAQGVYRAGETIQYKIYARNGANRRFEPAPKGPYTLTVTDPSGNEFFRRDKVMLNEFGALDGELKTSKTSAVGWYEFKLTGEMSDHSWSAFRVLVSDFTPVPFKVETRLNSDRFKPGDTLKAETEATMHAGGPFAKAPARITGLFRGKWFSSADPRTSDFIFDQGGSSDDQLFVVEESLDGSGKHQHSFKLDQLGPRFGTVIVESAVADDRGKNVASVATATYSGLDRRVGLKTTDWTFQAGKEARVLWIVIDEQGKPVPGVAAEMTVEREEIKAAKVKGAGNAYLNEYVRELVKIHECKGRSKTDPEDCRFVPPAAGSYKVTARIKDTRGQQHEISLWTYAVGKGRVLWGNEDDLSLPLIPERSDYRVGDKARFLVKNPLPGATALVTVERYGVIKSWTRKLEGAAEILEIPVEEDFVPGFYLSVVVVSPRVQGAPLQGDVDLGKPAFRMGLLQVDVKDPYKEIVVAPASDRPVYRPREKVKVSLEAKPRNGARNEPIELAVAVLDEAVLALIQGGTNAYDPYRGFYSLDGLDVSTYNLLTRLVGRQKFEKKGANQGGGGGLADPMMRSQFKFVSYWNPSLKTDSRGRAQIEFEVPDNLTGWRILAMAVTKGDRMGLGHANFKVNKPTEIRPVMPNQVSEGDRFKAGFSVMNRAERARKIAVAVSADGLVRDGKAVTFNQTLELAPHERKSVFLEVPAGWIKQDRSVSEGEIRFQATARDSEDQDGLVHQVPVHKLRILETAAAYGSTTDAKVSETVQFPGEIFTDVGSVSVVASPSVIGNVEGTFEYMRDYPYVCWEQRLTKGVMASHFLKLKGYVPGVRWPEAAKLPQETLDLAESFQAPNGGMAFFLNQDEYVSPYLSAYTALAFHWMREAGHRVPEKVEAKLHDYLLSMLKNRVVPTFYNEGMESTVRAVALSALARARKIDGAEVNRFLAHMPKMSLFGKAHFLQAALMTENTENARARAADRILSQGNQTSGKFMFNETWEDVWERVLATPLRDNCAVLSGLVVFAGTPQGEPLVSDIPFRLVRSITQSRGARTHFENTQENVFCLQALIDYAARYEKTPPAYSVTAALGGKTFGSGSFKSVTDQPLTFERPLQESDPGSKAVVDIVKKGQGRLYYATRVSYALKNEKSGPINAGLDLRREYHVKRKGKWELLGGEAVVKRGELIRVDLFLSVPSARNFVVVNDPVPGGFEPVNRDFANTSSIDAEEGAFRAAGGSHFYKFSDWQEFLSSPWAFHFVEMRHKAVRFYSEYLPPGNYRLSYTAQAIASGEFASAGAFAEEMYDPDVHGKSVPAKFKVAE